MSTEIQPAVSDALREAVAQGLCRFFHGLAEWSLLPEDIRAEWFAHADRFIAGPIASEIARLTERATAAEAVSADLAQRLKDACLARCDDQADVARLTGERDAARERADKSERDAREYHQQVDKLTSGCPWEGPASEAAKYQPSDPCPVCGDTGEVNNDQPSRCVAYAGGRQNGLIGELRARAEAAEAETARLREAVRCVHDTFARDIAQGYRTKDKDFAVSVLSAALTSQEKTDV